MAAVHALRNTNSAARGLARLAALPAACALATCALAAGAFAATANAEPDPPPAATITGEPGGAEDAFGWAVSAGDVNGDQVPDLMVGAPTNDAIAGFAGRAYLFHGPVTSNRAAGSANARITAQAFGDNLGVSVSIAGDVNDDGFDDVLVGARGHDAPDIQSGRAYLFDGPISGSLSATQADATFTGIAFEELGWSVSSGGDLNDDGFADVVLGAFNFGDTNNFSVGRAYIFFGPVQGTRASASADAIVTGEFVNDQLGTSVAIVRDLNGDGVDDLVAGAPHGPLVFLDPGRAYVFFGPIAGEMSAAAADVVLTGEEDNDLFGTCVASAGDVNGDGLGDLLVGAEQTFNEGSGRAYLYLGPLLPAASGAAAPTATFIGEQRDDGFGHSVASAGDVNDDGYDDVIVGAWNNGAGGVRAGRAYVFFGPVAGTSFAADADLVLTGSASGDRFGMGVVGAGDQDGNGRGDLLVGAAQFFEGDPGLAYVFFGESLATDVFGGVAAPDGGVGPAFPNPTNGGVSVAARLDRAETMTMTVLDAGGRRVRSFAPRGVGPGTHRFDWDGCDERGRAVAAGVYFIRMESRSGAGGASTSTQPVTVVR